MFSQLPKEYINLLGKLEKQKSHLQRERVNTACTLHKKGEGGIVKVFSKNNTYGFWKSSYLAKWIEFFINQYEIWPYTCLHFFIDSIIKMRYFLLRGAEFSAFFTSPYLQHTKMKNYLFEMINKFQTSRNTVWYVCSWRTRKLIKVI